MGGSGERSQPCSCAEDAGRDRRAGTAVRNGRVAALARGDRKPARRPRPPTTGRHLPRPWAAQGKELTAPCAEDAGTARRTNTAPLARRCGQWGEPRPHAGDGERPRQAGGGPMPVRKKGEGPHAQAQDGPRCSSPPSDRRAESRRPRGHSEAFPRRQVEAGRSPAPEKGPAAGSPHPRRTGKARSTAASAPVVPSRAARLRAERPSPKTAPQDRAPSLCLKPVPQACVPRPRLSGPRGACGRGTPPPASRP